MSNRELKKQKPLHSEAKERRQQKRESKKRHELAHAVGARFLHGLFSAIVESANARRIAEIKLTTEDGIFSVTREEWNLFERTGVVSLQKGVK